MKLVIPCAGRSTRMGSSKPKVLLEINGKSILKHIVELWEPLIDSIMLVVRDKAVILEMMGYRPFQFVIQEKPKGIADAILLTEPYIDGKFLVVLGDCLHKGTFDIFNFELGIGVWKEGTEGDIKAGYSVLVENGIVKRVMEKPRVVSPDEYCGMGIYFFDRRIFSYIKQTPASPLRDEVEITDVIEKMIEAGEVIKPVYFSGTYVNVNTPEDLERAEWMLQRNEKAKE